MKFRISPAAAAVFLAAGLFNSGLRAASAPAAIPFENDAAFNVTLSNTNPSKVVVDGELITSISGPTGAYDQSQTDDGALILSPLVSQNFTLFIQTDRGSSLSLNIRPQPVTGKHCASLRCRHHFARTTMRRHGKKGRPTKKHWSHCPAP